MSYTPAIVNGWYQAVQFQSGSAAVVASWVAGLNNGTTTPAQVQNYIVTQDSYTLQTVNPMIRLYQAAFNRVPDQVGQQYWITQYGTGAQTYQQIADGFANGIEFRTTYGSTGASQLANAAQVTQMYNNILLRSPDAGGLAYWTGKPIGQVLAGISASPEKVADIDVPIQNFQYAEIAGNAATSGSIYQYPGFPTTNYILTTGVDAPGVGAFASSSAFSVGSNTTTFGTFNAGAGQNTFTPGDQITAANGTTNATLNLSDGGTGGVGNVNGVAAMVSNITNLVANSGEALAANTTAWAGLQQISATTASQAAAGVSNLTTITAGANTSVTVTDTAAQGAAGVGTGGVTVNGGKNIIITENGATTTASAITVGGNASTNPSGTVSVVANRVSTAAPGNSAISVNGGTTVSVTQGQTGAVTIGNTTAATGAVTVTDTNGTVNSVANGTSPTSVIAVTGGSSITVTDNALVAGSGQVGINNGITLTGNASTAAITVNQTGIFGSLAATAGGAGSVIVPGIVTVGGNTTASAGITVNGGTNVTINTTGNFAGGSVAVGGTTAQSGTVAIVNTNSLFASADAVSVDANGAANTTGAISITTTRSSGAILVGSAAASQGVSGNVTVVNQTAIANGSTYYGAGTVGVPDQRLWDKSLD